MMFTWPGMSVSDAIEFILVKYFGVKASTVCTSDVTKVVDIVADSDFIDGSQDGSGVIKG